VVPFQSRSMTSCSRLITLSQTWATSRCHIKAPAQATCYSVSQEGEAVALTVPLANSAQLCHVFRDLLDGLNLQWRSRVQ